MNQRDIATQKRARKSRARTEWPTLIGLVATVVVMVFQAQLFGDLSDTPLTLVKFLGLFGVMMVCAFGVVRHAMRWPSCWASLTARSCSRSRSR